MNTSYFIPAVPRRRRRRGERATRAAFTLVAVEYQEALSVRLTFNRAINIGAIKPNEIALDDPVQAGERYAGMAPATMPDAQSVLVPLVAVAGSSGTVQTLTVTPNVNIVAEDDNTPWEGVTDLVLPFPGE